MYFAFFFKVKNLKWCCNIVSSTNDSFNRTQRRRRCSTLLCHFPIIYSLLAIWRHHAHHNSIYSITTHGGKSSRSHGLPLKPDSVHEIIDQEERTMTPNALESWALFGWAAFNRPRRAAQAGGGAAPDSSTTSKMICGRNRKPPPNPPNSTTATSMESNWQR